MSTLALVTVALVAVLLVVGTARLLDARSARRRRPSVADSYLAQSGDDNVHPTRLPRWITALVVLAAISGTVGAPVAIATALASDRRDQSDRLRGCTSTISTELIGAPQAIALKRLGRFGFDSPEFRAATDRMQPERYQKLTRLALTDQKAFLDECDRIVGAANGAKVAPYPTCAAAEAAGVAPLRSSDAGYNPRLDSDHDGKACE